MKISRLSLCALAFAGISAYAAQQLPTITVQDASAQKLIEALQSAGLVIDQVSDQLAVVQATGLACTSHSNAAFDSALPIFAIGTQECRVNVSKDEGPFSSTGTSIAEAHFVGEAIQNTLTDAQGGWDCAMMKCATGVTDIACSINLKVQSTTGRFSCALIPYWPN